MGACYPRPYHENGKIFLTSSQERRNRCSNPGAHHDINPSQIHSIASGIAKDLAVFLRLYNQIDDYDNEENIDVLSFVGILDGSHQCSFNHRISVHVWNAKRTRLVSIGLCGTGA